MNPRLCIKRPITRVPGLVATCLSIAVLLVAMGAAGRGANKTKNPSGKPASARSCVKQRPQKFLIRSTYLSSSRPSANQASKQTATQSRAVRYRIQEYGSVPGVGPELKGVRPVIDSITSTTFFGHSIRVHKRIVKPLACAERAIKRECKKSPYTPKAVGGFRDYNSYRGDEVSNHAFGIAIDIDPELNPCCHCVAPWPDNPRCKTPASSIYDRIALPRCWVKTFERFGFYWLGHDQLEDTMHFEFLGNPDRYGEE